MSPVPSFLNNNQRLKDYNKVLGSDYFDFLKSVPIINMGIDLTQLSARLMTDASANTVDQGNGATYVMFTVSDGEIWFPLCVETRCNAADAYLYLDIVEV